MGSHRDIIMSPVPRKFKPTRKLSIDPLKDYSTPLQVETSVEYDLPQHIYPPKGARPILMVHPGYDRVPTSSIPPTQFMDRKYYVISDYRKRSDSNVCKKQKCECDICGTNPAKKISLGAKANNKYKMPLGDTYSNTSVPAVPLLHKAPSKSVVFSAIENRFLPEEIELIKRAPPHQVQPSVQNIFPKETLWNPAVPQNDAFATDVKRCQLKCCNNGVPSRSEFLAPGLPPSLVIRTPGRSTAGSPKVRARSRRTANAVNSVPDYFSAVRPLRSLTTGPNVTSSVNHQRSRSNIALYSTTQSQQISSSLTQQPVLNQLPQTISSSTVGLCRDSGCSIGTDSSLGSSGKHFNGNLDRISLGADSGFNTPGDSPFDVMESNDVNNNSSVLYSRSTPLANKYCAMITPTYAHHLMNIQNSIVQSSFAHRYQVNPILQPYYNIREPLLNLAY